jgi:dipeptidyl aminopeptidase/acylaminoacyl peptidase
MPAKKKRPITAADLYRFQLISDCQLSPDGRHVILAVQRVDRKSEKKYSNLWIVPADGGEARQFTYGDQTDSRPRWSPDGAEIAFLSNRGNTDQPQFHLIPFHGGEARPLTDLRGEFGDFSWSPDGRKFICSFRKKDREASEREDDDQKKELGVVDRHITRTFFKLDGYGYLPRERWHLWTIDACTGRGKQLTNGAAHDETSPCWSPDGAEIAFLSNRSDESDLDPDAVDLFLISAKGGAVRKIKTPLGDKGSPSFSPDGRSIAYLGGKGRGNWWQNQCLWLVPADNSGKARNLTEKFDLHASDVTLGDLAGLASSQRPTWSKEGDRIYFQVSRHGSTLLYSIAPSGRRDSLRIDFGEDGAIGSFNFDQDQSNLACVHAHSDDPGQAYLRDAESGTMQQLTHFNPWLRDIDLGKVEEIWFEGGDGQVQGWILKPPGFRSSRKYPSILQIHGGPFMQYGKLLMHEFQFLAAQGYVVYFCNPRGSQGYGAQHVKPLWQNWGEPDFVDLMNFADLMVEKPYIDAERMGVTGGSYGGFMTAWIIGHTHRFAAAVAQRVVSNMISMWGSSDFNWSFQHECGNKPPWENLAEFWRQSPMKHIGSARTPTLVIHSERDLRCAQEQGEQLYVALKKLGVDTELVLFPDEPHGLSRGGRTDRRIARLHHLQRWFDRYLKP